MQANRGTGAPAPANPLPFPFSEPFTERVTAPVWAAPASPHDRQVAALTGIPDQPPPSEAGTQVADSVVARIAAAAALEVPGVHMLTSPRRDPVVRLLRRMNGSGHQDLPGVRVKVGREDVGISVTLCVLFGVSIPRVVDAVRANVTGKVQTLTGLAVRGVAIEVTDLHDPEAAVPPVAAAPPSEPNR